MIKIEELDEPATDVLLLARETFKDMAEQYRTLRDKGKDVKELEKKLDNLARLYNLAVKLVAERGVLALYIKGWESDLFEASELKAHFKNQGWAALSHDEQNKEIDDFIERHEARKVYSFKNE